MAASQLVNISRENVATLKQIKPPAGYVNIGTIERWASLIGGSSMALFGLGWDILRRKPSITGISFALVGGGLIYRGVTRHSYLYQALDINTAAKDELAAGMRAEKAVTINRPPEYLSHFWQDLDSFNQHTSTVTATMENKEFPEGRRNELDAWHTLKASVAAQSGYVHFDNAPQGCGIEVKVVFSKTAPLGKFGKLFGKSPEQQISKKLRHFKSVMEAGEIPTTKGQSSGRDERSSEK